MAPPKERVLSGMRPTGPLHAGHLVGALENWVELQDRYDCFFFVADLHALTSDYADPSRIRDSSIENLACWLAAGVDPERCTVFIQSEVPQHCELAVLLSMITPIGWLERVPTWKEQRAQLQEKDLNTHGFLGYPVLQAADVMIYRSSYVPVGDDQVAHLELTREIARRFNNLYGETFPEPQPLLSRAPRLPGTDGRKMSKSYGNTIDLGDTADEISAELRTMLTDPARKRRDDPGNPFICPVYHLHEVFSSAETIELVEAGCVSAELGCVDCKRRAADALDQRLAPLREERRRLLEHPDHLREILDEGSRRAREVAAETLALAQERMGLDYRGALEKGS